MENIVSDEDLGNTDLNELQLAAAETLRGDLRDTILAEFKASTKPWSKLSEDEQSRLMHRAADIAGKLVVDVIDIVAERGLPALPIIVGKMTVDGSACKGTFECHADDENLLRIRHLQGARAMFVLASPDRFNGEQQPAETENVGDLAMPKTGNGAPSDPDGLANVGRGKARAALDLPADGSAGANETAAA